MSIDAARRVLERNWTGAYTVPATGLYPHQWSWDSAFIAIGLRHVEPARARTELRTLLAAQWRDGRVPQIVYDVERDDEYAPGDAFWRSRDIPASGGVASAGLVQPPNHALAVWLVHEADPKGSRDEGFLAGTVDHLARWHAYLAERRASRDDRRLVVVRHPWEAGTDNSPLWDEALARIPAVAATPIRRPDLAHAAEAERPGQREYARYYHLAERYRDAACHDDEPSPFAMVCPMTNALLAVSELALARIRESLGHDGEPHRARAGDIVDALERLWDAGLGCWVARDDVSGELVRKATVNGLVPLLVDDAHREAVLATIAGPRFLGSSAHLPSYDATATDFDPALYWRGPSWFSTSWLVWRSLQSVGADALAERIGPMVRDLGAELGFPEYVDPHTGEPHGTRQFSWTAALAIDAQLASRLDLPR